VSNGETWLPALSPALLGALHLAATVGWLLLAAAVAGLRDAPAWVGRLQAVVAALLAGLALPLASAGGWWVDMPAPHVVPHLAAAAALLALAGVQRLPGRLAALALAGFFLALAVVALRNGSPLPPWVAAKALILGLALVLLCVPARRAAGLTVALLLAAAVLGVHRDIPFP
jgi:hypothetical protein